MAVKIIEFLGMNANEINSSDPRLANKLCPYINKTCKKIDRYGQQKPMCVVESKGGLPLIVCEHRLLSTDMENPTSYQRSRLLEISKVVFEDGIAAQDIEYKYEVTTKLRQRADFILRDKRNGDACILEIQGGGETSSTKILSDHITRWENGENVRLDDFPFRVTKTGKKATPGLIPANAWRRLQEQLIVKGGICISSEKKFVAAMGKTIYLHLLGKLPLVENLKRQKSGAWNCAFISYKITEGVTIDFEIDLDNILYLDLKELINRLIEYGEKDEELFTTNMIPLEES
ncbi:MAG TPA: hypothetical protein DDW51_23640 [Cyanobacteria bacterium UBA11367]|nr:hypothetical protein [Cyanobacteria bacterium UBA11367]HBS70514.1 hypothetical protein [Cyanobacteria bacterium UBA11153]